MVNRYLSLIEEGLDPTQIVAITFTNRAADELRSRIRAVLAEKYGASSRQVLQLDSAQISTIHSFAGDLIRAFPDQAGVTPDFAIIDESDYQDLVAFELPRIIALLDPPDLDLDDLIRLVSTGLTEPRTALRALKVEPGYVFELIEQDGRRYLERVHDLLEQCRFTLESTTAYKTSDPIEIERKKTLDLMNSYEMPYTLLRGLEAIKLRGGSAKNWPAGALEEIKGCLSTLREIGKGSPSYLRTGLSPSDELALETLEWLKGNYPTITARLDELLEGLQRITYNDLERYALKLLGDDKVLAELDSRYEEVMVDEYQDVSQSQYDIVEALSKVCRIALVGDHNQSIYGFRGAAPHLFEQTAEKVKERIRLDTNYRTEPRLLEAINTIAGSFLPRFEPLLPGRKEAGFAPIVKLLVTDQSSEDPVAAKRMALAERVAELISDLMASRCLVCDPKTGKERPIRPGDIAVILNTWDQAEELAQLFRDYNIPAAVASGNLLSTRAALDGLALLRLKLNPDDLLAKVAVLRSPMVALADTELQQVIENWQQDERVLRLRKALLMTAPDLASWLKIAGDFLGYPAILSALDPTGRMIADWEGLLELLDRLISEGYQGAALIAKLQRYRQGPARISRPPLIDSEAVTISSIHNAKGLEWPLVAVLDLDREPRRASAPLFDPELGIAVPGLDPTTAQIELIKDRKNQLLEEERKRLWYVAITRARDHLIVGFVNPETVSDLFSAYQQVADVEEIDVSPRRRSSGGLEWEESENLPITSRYYQVSQPISIAAWALKSFCTLARPYSNSLIPTQSIAIEMFEAAAFSAEVTPFARAAARNMKLSAAEVKELLDAARPLIGDGIRRCKLEIPFRSNLLTGTVYQCKDLVIVPGIIRCDPGLDLALALARSDGIGDRYAIFWLDNGEVAFRNDSQLDQALEVSPCRDCPQPDCNRIATLATLLAPKL
jgi:ATP-dependent helicase/nuclease subunit A